MYTPRRLVTQYTGSLGLAVIFESSESDPKINVRYYYKCGNGIAILTSSPCKKLKYYNSL